MKKYIEKSDILDGTKSTFYEEYGVAIVHLDSDYRDNPNLCHLINIETPADEKGYYCIGSAYDSHVVPDIIRTCIYERLIKCIEQNKTKDKSVLAEENCVVDFEIYKIPVALFDYDMVDLNSIILNRFQEYVLYQIKNAQNKKEVNTILQNAIKLKAQIEKELYLRKGKTPKERELKVEKEKATEEFKKLFAKK